MKRYNWLPGESVKSTIEPLEASEGLPSGSVMTADEKQVWRELWAARLARGVTGPVSPPSVLHTIASPCDGLCPNGRHGAVR